ncbi:MAG: arginyltransferase [Gammaproteobacteria bacterium]|nr:arginyltransferase [Gammaproteobacteria bacterium]
MSSVDSTQSSKSLALFASPAHECSYLPQRQAVSIFADPSVNMSMAIYSRLVNYGFRRSSEHVYSPSCPHCSECKSIRVAAIDFKPNRAQRRIQKRNKDIQVTRLPATFNHEHFTLYQRYMSIRHAGSSMENPSKIEYMAFLSSSWSDTFFYEFRDKKNLVAVTVADKLTQGLSAVYTFFDPQYHRLSPGSYAILWLIEETRALQLNWLYLGYWIQDCQKMQYKAHYQPAELLHNGCWTPFAPA